MNIQPPLGTVAEPNDEIVAALAAVEAFLAAEQPPLLQRRLEQPNQRWRDSGKPGMEHLRPGRSRVQLRWATVERLRSDSGGGFSVIGL